MNISHFFKTFLILFTAFSFIACNSDDDQQIQLEELPEQAIVFLETHFPDADILKITVDSKNKYEVKLNNGFEIDFDQNGSWIEIEGHGQQIPDAIIPLPILDYVQTNYSDLFIEEISKTTDKYKVDLSNDLEIHFDLDGNFLGIDY